MAKKIKFTVTKRDYDLANKNREFPITGCLIATALSRSFNRSCEVGMIFAHAANEKYILSKSATRIIGRFLDRDKMVRASLPQTFTMTTV